ncbi:MAG: OadG family protein [Candidatus Delongbacteria bacterium]
MRRKILTLLFVVIGTVFCSPLKTDNSISFKALTDSIPDSEFRSVVLKTLQKNNATNKDQFIKDLKHLRSGNGKPQEVMYGMDNISREYKTGMTGWDVALSGIVVVFLGLILIAGVVILFNLILKQKTPLLSTPTDEKDGVSPDNDQAAVREEILEDHVVAIATAVELYIRLYIHDSQSNLTFTSNESSGWKTGSRVGIRKTQGK